MKRVLQGFEFLSGGLLILLSVLIFVQVLLRNFIGWGFPWSEEMARYLLLTMVLLMSPVLFLRDEHIRLDFFSHRMSPGLKKLYGITVVLVTLLFFGVYVYSHMTLIKKMGNVRTPSLNMSNLWFFMAGLVGAILGLAAGFYRLIKLIFSGDKQ